MVYKVPDTTIEANLERMCQTPTFYIAQGSANTNQDGYQVPMARRKKCVCPDEAQKIADPQMIGLAEKWRSWTRRRRNLLQT